MNDKLIKTLAREYNLVIHSWRVLHNTPKSLVIRLQTNRGTFFAKSLYASEKRQQFILEAEDFLRQRRISIPPVEKTKENQAYIMWNHSPLLLQHGVPGRPPVLRTPYSIRQIGSLLGRLHAASIGFRSTSGKTYNGALTWEQEYAADLARLKSWLADHEGVNLPKIRLIRRHLPFFLRAGRQVHRCLQQSAYFRMWKAQPEYLHPLCHGDFHTGNLLRCGSTLTVIDWEDVRYDFPSKDLSRLLYVLMRRDRCWRPDRWALLINAYRKQHPLDKQAMTMLYQDLAFPHLVERFVRRRLYKRMTWQQIHRFLRMERQKTAYMLRKAKARA
ncbi:phosphotransferase [Brevibacillus sp. SYP-B805]|uniref:phosphotransferase n=1 Tax=Brevibacillus sp. SYP-B805 TaxID=1578199 RepID=UPI0013E9BF3D|nr:phosphotransferase [Brevibacillus sp. SYP-B805]NGQ94805.1 phosphotransferase [Brevibacillus sp. SYP-B805]